MTVVSDFRAILAEVAFRWNKPVDRQTKVIATYSFVEDRDVPSTDVYEPYENDGYFAFAGA